MPNRVTRQKWLQHAEEYGRREKIEDTVALYGLTDISAPPGMTLIGWMWEHGDGSYGLVKLGENVGVRDQPKTLRPVWVESGERR